MDHQAKVTLTALNGDLSIAERTLTLTAKDNIIPVGRASKSVTKGILGAVDNAWFDSPVMSRNHATIEFNPDVMTITIQDIGSMHGTHLNNIDLPKDTPTVITDGDIVVFGAEVRRGPETFPACSFRVNHKIISYKAANTFAFPESSDVEEDEEDNYDAFSEDHMEMGEREQRYSSEDGVSIESAPIKPSQASGAIDLTEDDLPRDSVSNQVDLTGETDTERRIMDVLHGRPSDIDENTDPISISIYAGNDPIVLDSDDEEEDEDADFSSDLDEQSEDNVSRDSDRLRIHAVFEDDSEEIEDSENEGSMEDSEMDSDAGFDEGEPIVAPKPTVISNLTRYAVATDDSPVIRLSDVRTRLELPTSDKDDDPDDESDFGLSEAGAEGMKALYGASSTIPDHDVPDFEGESENEDQSQVEEFSPQIMFSSTQEMDMLAHTASSNAGEPSNQGSLLRPFSIVRQPSPSDAAMVKGAILTKKVGLCDLGESGDYSPQALGEKSGKPAFFAAREINKAKFGTSEPDRSLNAFQASNRTINTFLESTKPQKSAGTPATPNAGASHRSRWDEPPVEQAPFATDNTVIGNCEAEPSMPTFVGSSNAVSSIPTRGYCSFLDRPDESPILERTPSPLPDMTSSFSYNTSKDTMMLTSNKQHNARSAIKITDIVESSTPAIRTNSLKRKSDNISDATDKELRDWANSNVSSDLTAAPATAAVHGEKSNVPSNVDDAPSAKRFKKLLANAGYVALGGATLFAALVATAPDLM